MYCKEFLAGEPAVIGRAEAQTAGMNASGLLEQDVEEQREENGADEHEHG